MTIKEKNNLLQSLEAERQTLISIVAAETRIVQATSSSIYLMQNPTSLRMIEARDASQLRLDRTCGAISYATRTEAAQLNKEIVEAILGRVID